MTRSIYVIALALPTKREEVACTKTVVCLLSFHLFYFPPFPRVDDRLVHGARIQEAAAKVYEEFAASFDAPKKTAAQPFVSAVGSKRKFSIGFGSSAKKKSSNFSDAPLSRMFGLDKVPIEYGHCTG